jgi:hypothetical protein
MSILAPFQPKPGSTLTGTAGASQNVAVDGASKQILIANFGAAVMFVRIKNSADTTVATAADCPVLPNTYLVLSKMGNAGKDAQDAVAIFGTAGTFYITSGEGWS